MMDAGLTKDHNDFRETVRRFAEEKIGPSAASNDIQGRLHPSIYDALVRSDLNAVTVPSEYGGVGADPLASALAVEEIARVCASTSTILTSNGLGVTPLVRFGSDEQRSRFLPSVASGEALMAYALSEREAGSDISALRCRAVESQSGYTLNGTKSWVTSAGLAGILIVFACTDPTLGRRGISAFIVLATDPGISYGEPEKKMGLRGSVTREVIFENCQIPEDRLLGRPGTGISIALETLDHTRVSIAAQAVGIAQGALDFALSYVGQRQQFGRSISDFQGVQFMLAEMGMQIAAARQLVYTAAGHSQTGSNDLSFYGAAAKCFASDVAMKVTTDAVQLLGGYGYVQDFPVERMMRDAKITQIYEGTNQIQRVVMARELLRHANP